jgi:4a-hydroxytetrahydrobiopterin dehydratase
MADTLSGDEVRAGLDELDGWSGDTAALRKRYELGDFTAAMGFVMQVALIAERLYHHPDISISWGTVDLVVTSHAAGGVTAQCLELARRIEARAPGGGG